jgi:hypothetical protein
MKVSVLNGQYSSLNGQKVWKVKHRIISWNSFDEST